MSSLDHVWDNSDSAVATRKEIRRLKDQLRGQYLRMQSLAPGYSCGHELTKYINSAYATACQEVNHTLDALAKIDPETPTKRF